MKTLAALAALLLIGATAARADEPTVDTDVIVPPSVEHGAPGLRSSPAMRPHQHHRYRYRYALPARGTMLPGVLGMDLGAPVYWRPGVPSLPDVVFVYAEGEHLRRGEVVRARY
jgi:hypothetical protein